MKRFFRSMYDTLFRDLRVSYALLPRRLRMQVVMLFGLMMTAAFFEVASIGSLAYLGMSIASPEAARGSFILAHVLRAFPTAAAWLENQGDLVFGVSLAVFILFVAKNISSAVLTWHTAKVGTEIGVFFGGSMMHCFLNSPYEWHISEAGGRMQDAINCKEQLGMLLIYMLSVHAYAITSVALIATLLSTTPDIILALIVIIAALCVGLYLLLKNRVDRAGTALGKMTLQEHKAFQDAAQGIREVIIYRQQEIFFRKYMDVCRAALPNRTFLAMAGTIPTWILEILGIAVIPLSVWVLAVRDRLDMGVMAAVVGMVMLTAWRILPMVNRSLSALLAARTVRAQAETAVEQMKIALAAAEKTTAAPNPHFVFEREIRFENVWYRYPAGTDFVLRGLNLRIRKGEQAGFVGLSGTGKSTVAALLSGLLAPSQGRILVDGKFLTEADLAAFRGKIAYVSQTPYILEGTIAENVAFSEWGRPPDRARAYRACTDAAFDLVRRPEDLDMRVAANGAGLSGGQAQRLSIARALYCRPELLILDESTSSLDQKNENAIMETVQRCKGDITIVLIAHRLTTLERCDVVFWLRDGTIKTSGNAGELLEAYKTSMKEQKNDASA